MNNKRLIGVTIVLSLVTLIFGIFGKDASICGSLLGFKGTYAIIFTWSIWAVFLIAILLSIVWLIQQIFRRGDNGRRKKR